MFESFDVFELHQLEKPRILNLEFHFLLWPEGFKEGGSSDNVDEAENTIAIFQFDLELWESEEFREIECFDKGWSEVEEAW